MNLPSRIPEILEFVQNKYGYTLHEIAEKLNLTDAAISRWNNGKSIPRGRKLRELKLLAEGKLIEKDSHPPPGDIDAIKAELSVCKEKLSKLDGFIEGLKAAGFFQQAEHSQQQQRQHVGYVKKEKL